MPEKLQEHHLQTHELTQSECQAIEEEQPLEVKKLHFLIHPGYAVDNLSKAFNQEFVALLDLYENYARALHGDELLVVFKEYRTFQNDNDATLRQEWRRYKKPTDEELQKRKMLSGIGALPNKRWVDCIDTIREMLGRRLVVLGGEHDIFEEETAKNTVQALHTIARARGFHIPKEVDMVCFGEYVDACVKSAAHELAKAFGRQKSLPVAREFTDSQIRRKLGLL